MKALVLDGHLKHSLATVRALGHLGVHVTTASENSLGLTRFSRYSCKHVVYPSPKTDQTAFVAWLLEWGQAQTEPVTIYAFADASFLPIARNRAQLAPYFILRLPASEHVETAFDKASTYTLARELGIPTIPEPTVEEVAEWPVVVKPQHSVAWHQGTGVFGTAEFAFTSAELEQLVTDITAATGEAPVIQTFIQGSEHGVLLVAEQGQVLQTFVHKRIRSLSPRGGASVVKETSRDTALNQLMIDRASALMEKLAWTGPAMIEFKVNDTNGEVLLMEINGRWVGSLPLAEQAGVRLVERNEWLQRESVQPPVVEPRLIRTQHWLGDFIHLCRVWFARDPLRPLLYPSRLRAGLAFDYSTLFDRGDIWSWRDPLPFVGEWFSTIQRKL